MSPRSVFYLCLASPLALTSCATSPYAPEPGPRVQPDDKEWRRKSLPLPPIYWRFTTGENNQWTMATPLYWQVRGADSIHRHLIPFASYSADLAVDGSPGESEGHVLNWFWKDEPSRSYRVAFPVYWRFEKPGVETSVYGPLYTRHEAGAAWRDRTILMPWLYSREKDSTGYDYWAVLFRLVGYEKQRFNGERKERLWLFFVFPIPVV